MAKNSTKKNRKSVAMRSAVARGLVEKKVKIVKEVKEEKIIKENAKPIVTRSSVSSEIITDWKEFCEKTGVKISTRFFYNMVKNGLVSVVKYDDGSYSIEPLSDEEYIDFACEHVKGKDGSIPTFKVTYTYDNDPETVTLKKLYDYTYENEIVWWKEPTTSRYQLVNDLRDNFRWEVWKIRGLNFDHDESYSENVLWYLHCGYEFLAEAFTYLEKNNLKFDFPLPWVNSDFCKENEPYMQKYDLATYKKEECNEEDSYFEELRKKYKCPIDVAFNNDIISDNEEVLKHTEVRGTDIPNWLVEEYNKEITEERERMDPSFTNPFKVGDILCGEKGYNMIIPCFYEVLKVTEKQVVVKKLVNMNYGDNRYNQTGFSLPCFGAYESNEFFRGKVVKFDNGNFYAHVDKVWVSRWDGNALRFDYMD